MPCVLSEEVEEERCRQSDVSLDVWDVELARVAARLEPEEAMDTTPARQEDNWNLDASFTSSPKIPGQLQVTVL